MRIGEVAAQAGVSVRALRYYEERGLLAAERSAAGQRRYAPAAVERVQLIQQLYAAGLSSRAIERLLPCIHTGTASGETLAHLIHQRDRIDQQLADLARTRDRLDAVIAAAAATAGCR